jgi:DNA-binding GntR family transcriptional regulator
MEQETGARGLRRISPTNLAAQAHEAIVEAIFDRQLEPGARLSIEEVAKRLGMSATPVREALARAAGQGLVTRESNRGFSITPLLSEREFHDLFEFRRQLETSALGRAEPDSGAVRRLEEIVALMPAMEHGAVYRDFREFNQADREFHRVLVVAGGNKFLMKAWEDLHFHLQVGRLYAGVGVIDFGDALREHAAIVEALKVGKKKEAVLALKRHVESAERRLVSLLPVERGTRSGR